jgi:hypothetical protein
MGLHKTLNSILCQYQFASLVIFTSSLSSARPTIYIYIEAACLVISETTYNWLSSHHGVEERNKLCEQ